MVRLSKWKILATRMQSLGILPSDINEKFTIGSGKGGQKRHKSASCVQLEYSPHSLHVYSDKSRSQTDNRYHARVALCEQLEIKLNGKKSERAQRNLKKRKQKQRRYRRNKNTQHQHKNPSPEHCTTIGIEQGEGEGED